MGIKYIVEIAQRTSFPPELALASAYYGVPEIYTLGIGRFSDTYWTDWGGTYDNPTSIDIQLFFGQYLAQVETTVDLLATEYSFYVRTGAIVDINLPKKPWQFLTALTELLQETFYASAVKDSSNPADTTYINSLGEKQAYPVRMQVPSLAIKLSDSISGETRYGTFKVVLDNNDGKFDLIDELEWTNVPITIKRTDVEVPVLSDYVTIRKGLIDYVTVKSDSIVITSAEFLRLFTETVCKTFSLESYPDIDEAKVDDSIPIGYGVLRGVPLVQVGSGSYTGGVKYIRYLALDPDYITALSAVYSADGVELNKTFRDTGLIDVWSAATSGDVEADDDNTGTGGVSDLATDNTLVAGVFRLLCTSVSGGVAYFSLYRVGDSLILYKAFSLSNTEDTEYKFSYAGLSFVLTVGATIFVADDFFDMTFEVEPGELADVTGKTNCTVGEIITNEIALKSATPYTSANWDQDEVEAYILDNPAALGFYFDSDGDIKDLIKAVLLNDSAFLLTKNDGRLTIRRWGLLYDIIDIPSWEIMEIPEKSTQDTKDLHLTSAKIQYDLDQDSGDYSGSFIYADREIELEERYRKTVRTTFPTDLTSEADAKKLAELLLDRFGIIPEVLTVSLGYNTSAINPLDIIILDVVINKRRFSNKQFWVVVGANPAQDTLTLWSIESLPTSLGLYGNKDIIHGYEDGIDKFAHGFSSELGYSVVTDDMLLWIDAADFENSPETTLLTDRSESGRDGVPYNFGYTDESGAAGDGSIAFDGIDDYIVCGTSPAITGDFTWVVNTYIDSDALITGVIFGNRLTAAGVDTFVKITPSRFEYYSGGVQYGISQIFAREEWVNICCVKSGGILSIYVNGNLTNSVENISLPSMPELPLAIGANSGSVASEFFKGKVSFAGAYSRALTEDEITQNYLALRKD